MPYKRPTTVIAEKQTKAIEGDVLAYVREHPGAHYRQIRNVLCDHPETKKMNHNTLGRALARLKENHVLTTLPIDGKRVGYYLNNFPGAYGNGKVIAAYLDSIDLLLRKLRSKYRNLSFEQKLAITTRLAKQLCYMQSGLLFYPILKCEFPIERRSELVTRLSGQLEMLSQIISSDDSVEKVVNQLEISFSQSEAIKSIILFESIKIKKGQNDDILEILSEKS